MHGTSLNRAMALLCFAWFRISGCSWQATAYEGRQALQKLSASDWVRVEDAPRWRLPSDVSLELAAASPSAEPEPWRGPAQRGIATVFLARHAPDYRLQVMWPDTVVEPNQAERRWGLAGALFGLDQLPKLRGSIRVPVHILDVDNKPLHTLGLVLQPGLSKSAQSQPADALVEAAFSRLARELRGG